MGKMLRGLFLLFALIGMVAGCKPSAILIQPVSSNRGLRERIIQQDAGWFVSDKIAVIDVDGVLMNGRRSGMFGGGENPVSLFVEKLDRAENDIDVKAVVLRLNTPGGTVSASDAMYHALSEFKSKSKKPVVGCMLGTAASGGYYLACGCDRIVAQPSCITGSIGTIMQTVSFAGTMEKLGIKAVAIKSGDLKDLASPMKELRADEKEVLQNIITQFYEQFLTVIRQGRKELKPDKLRKLADGRVFTAKEAMEEGLIDRIGYPKDAIAWAKEMAGVGKSKVVIYQRPIGYKPNVYGSALNPIEVGALVNVKLPHWLRAEGPQFLYLWQPGVDW